MAKPKILLLIPHLGGGGAERVTALLASGLDPERFSVHLGVVTQTSFGDEELPRSVRIHNLGARRVRYASLPLLRLVRRVRPDCILSGMQHLNQFVLALRPLFPGGVRVLIRQNAHLPDDSKQLSSGLSGLLFRLLYTRADGIICQTVSMKQELSALLGPAASLHVIPNPIRLDNAHPSAAEPIPHWPGDGPRLLAAGRLVPEKGFDLLLDAFATVLRDFPDASLVILGEGPERRNLEGQASRLGIAASIQFPGYGKDPWNWFAAADLFALSSRRDAMPNALLEAAAAGLPIVALPAAGGVPELLRGKPGVWLGREISAPELAIQLAAALGHAKSNKRFAHVWIREFEIGRVVRQYEELMSSILARKGR